MRDAKQAVELLKTLVIDDYELHVPLHPYILSFQKERLGMDEEETTLRRILTKKAFPPNKGFDEVPVFTEEHKNGISSLIVSDPSCNLLTEKNGKYYTYPTSWELYDYMAEKIASENGLKHKRERIANDDEHRLYLSYSFLDN